MSRPNRSWLARYMAAANAMARVPDALQGGRSRRNVVEARTRDGLVDLAHKIAGKGLTWGTAGSLSARFGTHQVLLSRPEVPFEALTFDDLILARVDQPPPAAVGPEAWSWHLALYTAQPLARAMVHIQPPFATALSTQTQVMLPAVPEVAAYWPHVVWLESGGSAIEQVDHIAQAVARSQTLLIPSRGVICWAPLIPEILPCGETVEAAARIILLSSALAPSLRNIAHAP